MLESTTLEEANSDFVNWVKQRSRWYKGYLQTFLIHLRAPMTLAEEIRVKGVLHLCAFVGGTPDPGGAEPALLDSDPYVVRRTTRVRESDLSGTRVLHRPRLWAFGNFLLWYLTVLTARHIRTEGLVLAAVLVPVYWVMMSIAALKAMWQLVITPPSGRRRPMGSDTKPMPIPTSRSRITSFRVVGRDWRKEARPARRIELGPPSPDLGIPSPESGTPG